jgi:hypothetical protein
MQKIGGHIPRIATDEFLSRHKYNPQRFAAAIAGNSGSRTWDRSIPIPPRGYARLRIGPPQPARKI